MNEPLPPTLEQRWKAVFAEANAQPTKAHRERFLNRAGETELGPALQAAKELPEGHPDRTFAEAMAVRGLKNAWNHFQADMACQCVLVPDAPTAAHWDEFLKWMNHELYFRPEKLERDRRPSLGQSADARNAANWP